MKIAIITPSMLPVPSVKGGAVEMLIDHLINENEADNRLNITIFSPYDKDALQASKRYNHTDFVWLKYDLWSKAVNLFMRMVYCKITSSDFCHYNMLKTVRILGKANYDCVVIEGGMSQIGAISKVVPKSKLYFHLHAKPYDPDDYYLRCNKIITVSKYIAEQVLCHGFARKEDVVVLKNCTDISRFDVSRSKRETMRTKYGIGKSQTAICFTGRIVPEKGVKELMQAMTNLPSGLQFQLFIVGSIGSGFGAGSYKTEYSEELFKLTEVLGDRCHFTGFIHNSEIPSFLQGMDIAVVPSMYEEPGALTIFEHQAASLPIITTDSGGIPEYVTDESAIVIVRDEHIVDNISKALLNLILDTKRCKEMGMAGRKNVEQYNTKRFFLDFIDILNQ